MLFIIVQSWVGLVLVKFESFLGFLRWEFLSDVQIYDDESDWIHSFKIVTTNEAFVWEELLRFPNRRLFCFICFVLFIFIFLGKILGVYGWDLGIVMMTRKIIWWIFDDFLTSYSYWMSALNNCRLSPMKIWEKKDFFFFGYLCLVAVALFFWFGGSFVFGLFQFLQCSCWLFFRFCWERRMIAAVMIKPSYSLNTALRNTLWLCFKHFWAALFLSLFLPLCFFVISSNTCVLIRNLTKFSS